MKNLISMFKEKNEILILIVTLIILLFMSLDKFEYKKFPYGKEKEIIERIRQNKGLILSSLGVQGFENFNILSYF